VTKVSVIGGGYVGLVTAAGFADLGHSVCVLEIDPCKTRSLERGILTIDEPGLPESWQRNREQGRISVTGDYIKGLLDAEFAFVSVGTPSTRTGRPDLKSLYTAVRRIAETASGPLVVVVKSTVPVGTAEVVAGILARYGRDGRRFAVVSNPEFLREGYAVHDFMNPTRIVIGGSDRKAIDAVAGLYERIKAPVITCDNRTAEMSKYASNVFLAARISFMNEIASLCEEYGVNVSRIAEIMGFDPRFGKGYLNAGLGWGGSCLPKDVDGILHMAKSRGVKLRMISAAQKINKQQPQLVMEKLHRLLGPLENKTIGILGLAFKPNTCDMRCASSVTLISLLREQGCSIKAYDPLAMKAAAELGLEISYCADAYEVARDSDALVLVTEWGEFKDLAMSVLCSSMTNPVFIDGRNFFDPDAMLEAGFLYEGIGRRTSGKPAISEAAPVNRPVTSRFR